jgi:hypothetical protein
MMGFKVILKHVATCPAISGGECECEYNSQYGILSRCTLDLLEPDQHIDIQAGVEFCGKCGKKK